MHTFLCTCLFKSSASIGDIESNYQSSLLEIVKPRGVECHRITTVKPAAKSTQPFHVRVNFATCPRSYTLAFETINSYPSIMILRHQH